MGVINLKKEFLKMMIQNENHFKIMLSNSILSNHEGSIFDTLFEVSLRYVGIKTYVPLRTSGLTRKYLRPRKRCTYVSGSLPQAQMESTESLK